MMNRFRRMFSRSRLAADLSEEMQQHLEEKIEALVESGMPRNEAVHSARRAFGNATLIEQRSREVWMWPFIESICADIKFALRQLRKSPGFAAVAFLTLAIGIGANTAIFSLMNGLLLRPLPVADADQLVVLRMDQDRELPGYNFSAPLFRGLERQHKIFSDVFAFSGRPNFQVREGSTNESVRGMLASGEFFQALDIPPLIGRYLTPVDDRIGGNPEGLAAVVSEGFWQRWFHRDPKVVGRKLIIANVPFTVVGVMPKRFIGADPTQRPEIYVPLSAEPIIDAPENWIAGGVNSHWLTVMARRKSEISLQQTNAALLPMSMPIAQAQVSDGNWIAEAEKGEFHFTAEPGARGFTFLRMFFRKPLIAVFVMCGGILLLACLNLASLLTARSAARERELATRLALGATRARLIQQLLTESLLITLVGTMGGLAMAPLVARPLASMLMSGFSNGSLDISLDMRVFLFVAAIAAGSTLLIGLIPALQATEGNLNDHIKNGQHSRLTYARQRILVRLLVLSEVALTMVLVVGAGLLGTSLVKLYHSNLGFDPRGLVNVTFNMAKQPLNGDALTRLYQTMSNQIGHMPGVKEISWERVIPMTGETWDNIYAAPGGSARDTFENRVGPGYFLTMRIPVIAGREFQWTDTKPSGLKVILNRAAAKQLFPGKDALGQQVQNVDAKALYEVIGVVGDTKYDDLANSSPAMAYLPITQVSDTNLNEKKPSYTAVVRIDGPVAPLAAAARSLAVRLAPTIPAPAITTMDSVMNDSISSQRMMALLSLFFAGCALLITAIGLYGTLAYATARRITEIGVRMALGAQRAQVAAMVFRENARVAIFGCVAGLVAAILASRVLARFLYEISPHDPWVLLCSAGILLAIAAVASTIPALRAASIDPMVALRAE